MEFDHAPRGCGPTQIGAEFEPCIGNLGVAGDHIAIQILLRDLFGIAADIGTHLAQHPAKGQRDGHVQRRIPARDRLTMQDRPGNAEQSVRIATIGRLADQVAGIFGILCHTGAVQVILRQCHPGGIVQRPRGLAQLLNQPKVAQFIQPSCINIQ